MAVSMKAALLITVLASTYLFHAEAGTPDIPIHPDLDVQKLAGTWHRIAYALKDRKLPDVQGVDDVVEASDNGDMVLNVRYIQDGKCTVTPVHLEHTDTPGIFKIPATDKIIRMVDVDYGSYHIVHVEQNNTYLLYLLSRTRKVPRDARRKFNTLARTLGFKKNQIFNEKRADSCPQ